MLPALLLAAVVPGGVPGMDMEATALEATELLRGKWVLIYCETNGKAEAKPRAMTWRFDGRSVSFSRAGFSGVGCRLLPCGRWYRLVLTVDEPGTPFHFLGQIAFHGRCFHMLQPDEKAEVSVWERR